MENTKLALTLFNVREYCKNESDLDRTLDRLCQIGFKAVQSSLTVGVDMETLRRQLDKHNLICCAAAEGMGDLKDNIALVKERLQILGCKYTSLAYVNGDYRYTKAAVDELCTILNERGATLAESGYNLSYHNHSFEFFRIPGTGKTMLELIYEQTDPQYVSTMLDVHWVTRGGASPVDYINRYAGRMNMIHFKDFMIDNEDKPQFCEVGQGNLNWPSIIKACDEAKVKWFIVEQDAPRPERDIFESLKLSYDYLTSLGVK